MFHFNNEKHLIYEYSNRTFSKSDHNRVVKGKYAMNIISLINSHRTHQMVTGSRSLIILNQHFATIKSNNT